MKQWKKSILTLGALASFCCGVLPFGGIAFGAAPVVTVLPVFKDGTVTPTRLAIDGAGNVYVTDPHAGGVLKIDKVGKLQKIISTAQQAGGIAIGLNGDLLVTQGTYVVALDPVTGNENARFGTLKSAFAITIDPRSVGAGGTGRIYVSDISASCVQVFTKDAAGAGYSPVPLAAHDPGGLASDGLTVVPPQPDNSFGAAETDYGLISPPYFIRPAGVTFEKSSGRVAVVDSIHGQVKFFNTDGVYQSKIGQTTIGYHPTSVMFTYPQSIAFEYTAGGALNRAYVLDTNQDYVMVLDALDNPAAVPPTVSATPSSWKRLLDIGAYGHANGYLISPSDLVVDTLDPNNNRLFVSNGFGSLTVYGLGSLQPFNVFIDTITSSSMQIHWSVPSAPFNFIRVYRSTVAGQLGTQIGGDLPNTSTSLASGPLAQYTTYYYTVRAVDTGNVETTNVLQVSAKTTGLFNLAVNINGNGSINATPANASCTTGTCTTTSQPSDSLVTLKATAAGQSVFDAWTGDCFTTSDTCLVTMDAAKSVTANFSARLAFHVDGAYYDNLQEAYDKAQNNSVIKVLAGTWPSTTSSTEFMTAWQLGKTVYIEGGYEATFTSNVGGSSTVVGRTNLSAGKVVMKQFRLK